MIYGLRMLRALAHGHLGGSYWLEGPTEKQGLYQLKKERDPSHHHHFLSPLTQISPLSLTLSLTDLVPAMLKGLKYLKLPCPPFIKKNILGMGGGGRDG